MEKWIEKRGIKRTIQLVVTYGATRWLSERRNENRYQTRTWTPIRLCWWSFSINEKRPLKSWFTNLFLCWSGWKKNLASKIHSCAKWNDTREVPRRPNRPGRIMWNDDISRTCYTRTGPARRLLLGQELILKNSFLKSSTWFIVSIGNLEFRALNISTFFFFRLVLVDVFFNISTRISKLKICVVSLGIRPGPPWCVLRKRGTDKELLRLGGRNIAFFFYDRPGSQLRPGDDTRRHTRIASQQIKLISRDRAVKNKTWMKQFQLTVIDEPKSWLETYRMHISVCSRPAFPPFLLLSPLLSAKVSNGPNSAYYMPPCTIVNAAGVESRARQRFTAI